MPNPDSFESRRDAFLAYLTEGQESIAEIADWKEQAVVWERELRRLFQAFSLAEQDALIPEIDEHFAAETFAAIRDGMELVAPLSVLFPPGHTKRWLMEPLDEPDN